MADRKGGKAGDIATKQDKPSAEEGKGTPEKVAVEAAEAKAAEAAEAAEAAPAEPKKTPARKPAKPKAEATAAEATGVGKEEAEAAEKAPSGQKAEPAARTRARDKAEKAKASDEPAAATNGAAPGRVQVRAQAKYVRTSARKARLVCDHIRGKSVEEAFAILAHTPRAVAEDWRKLLQSAVANAEHNHELVGDDLRIIAVHADEGPTLKRFRPRAMGRATRIRKRTSHLTITLTPKEQ
jgi:ribosomal protein L22